MGMFDTIAYEAPCPICGTMLTNWQSKDAGCNLDHLTPAKLWEQSHLERVSRAEAARPSVRGGYTQFYENCNNCGTWVEIRLAPGHFTHGHERYGQKGPVIPGGDA